MKTLLTISILLTLTSVNAFAAFPTGWGRKAEIIIQSSQVDTNATNFVVYLSETNLPSEMFDNDLVKVGGGDIRFSSDENGSTRLAIEITTYDTVGTDDAQIYVLVASLASASNTSIWVWYDSSASVQPAEDAAFGSEAVWAGYLAVWHLEENPADDTNLDETSNDFDFNIKFDTTNMEPMVGQIGSGIMMGPNREGGLSTDSVAGLVELGDVTVTGWYQPPGSAADIIFGWAAGAVATYIGSIISVGGAPALDVNYTHWSSDVAVESNDWTDFDATASTWEFVSYIRDTSANEVDMYRAGSVVAPTFSYTDDPFADSTVGIIVLGTFDGGSRKSTANVDEWRVRTTEISAALLATEFNNQSAPATFAIEQAPEDGGGAPADPLRVRRRIIMNGGCQ